MISRTRLAVSSSLYVELDNHKMLDYSFKGCAMNLISVIID